jgi:uncharacterized protein YlzI (FlbEa/FlbD family)
MGMIRLYRHDSIEILLNVDLIRSVDSAPDTVITLVDGETIRVKNSEYDVVTKIKAARHGLYVESHDPNEAPEKRKPGRRS